MAHGRGLRTVFSEPHAVTIRATVTFQLSELLVDDGTVRDSERVMAIQRFASRQ